MEPKGKTAILDRDEELKLLIFLASQAGLFGIVVSVSNFQIGSASSTTVRTYFSVIYQFGGFWLTGFILSVIFYLALQRWRKNLKWQLETR
jgi:hypothetical protein